MIVLNFQKINKYENRQQYLEITIPIEIFWSYIDKVFFKYTLGM